MKNSKKRGLNVLLDNARKFKKISNKKHLVLIFLTIIALSAMVFLFSIKKPAIIGFTIYQLQPGSEGKDTYIRSDLENSNYGTESILRIGNTAAGAQLKSMIEFNLSAIPAGVTVTSAKLQFYVRTIPNVNMSVYAYRITKQWNETAACWNNATSSVQWDTAGGDYASNIFGSINISNVSSQWYNITISSLVRGWTNGSYDNYGLILIAPDAASGTYAYINSSDAAGSPMIIIDYTTNAPPTILNASTNSNLNNPKQIGEQVNFNISWEDLEGNNVQAYVCNSSNITFASGCLDKTFCSTSLASTNPIQCSYTITSSENRTTSFFATVCDSSNCSDINQSYFYVNHAPTILVVQPNGNEVVNQSQGNYVIRFNVSDADNDALFAGIYYGETQNSTTYTINSSLNLTNSCTDTDSKTSTTNNCSYSWNSTGIYGTYFLTIIVNDSYSMANDSSDSSFNVRSVVDSIPPNIIAQWIDYSDIHSGKLIGIYSNISDENAITNVWASINTTSWTNVTLTNTSAIVYNGTWTAVSVGNYRFKVYAIDIVGNLNDSMPWVEISIRKPNATTQNQYAPSTALPFHAVKITGELNATDSLKGIYAYLNVPDGFTFLSNYPQNSYLGNFSSSQIKNATWFVSVPLTEANYTLNISYTDSYSNSWNSSNFNIQVTSAVGGGSSYFVSVSGYPEVQTSSNYFAESYFTQSGTYANADSVYIRIYDAAGTLTAGPAAMNNPSTGIYNYTYAVGASVVEGQWQTIVNATKSSTSYYASQFFKVVGGPFDVRDIAINDAVVPDLSISVTAENTGGVAKDLTLVWNLTREDTGQRLTSGADTFAVNPYSNRTRTINLSTTYVGQVRITFLGYYSGTEKAGAYRIFSTSSVAAYCGDGTCNTGETCSSCPADCGACPSGVGGGGGGVIAEKKADFSIDVEKETYMTKDIEKIVSLKIKNTGDKELTNVKLEIENLDSKDYTFSPVSVSSINPAKSGEFLIKFLITDFIGEKDFSYSVKTNEVAKKQPAKLIVLSMKDFFSRELSRLEEKVSEIKTNITPELEESLKNCEQIIKSIEQHIEKEEFINAKNTIKDAENCIEKVEDKIKGLKEVPIIKVKMVEYWAWIVTWALILVLIIILAVIIYLLYKKLSILNFLKQGQKHELKKQELKEPKKEIFEEKIKSIEEKIKE